ncbi:SRPBCC family protein [Saccharopolyspora erythraea]|uniref:SRPBCC family protein n=1 Tax=Saccharopolyspora erythraea TaxID=1836 RepID=UPI001BA97F4C|nr:SRPBCC family protein [Saccharopolyspora erythraea]QUG99888.1 SRPBCC family protein [Saccharopolyspora erythraea]
MQMQHHFTVPVPVDVAWKALLDPERVAPCMPGATLTKSEGDEFAGTVKVKLGPVSLLYKGTGTFTEVDEAGRRAVIEASGKDSRGNGTAAATVTAVLTAADGGTSVQVDTDLKITGKPAQLGRGLISEVGGKILNQFAGCLSEKLAGEPEAPAEPETSAPAGETASTGDADGVPASEPSGSSVNGDRSSAARAAGEDAAAASESAQRETAARTRRPGWRVTPPSGEGQWSSTAQETAANRADAVVTGKPMPSDEAIDLLGTAGAPVLKRVAPIAAAVIGLLIVLRLLRRRRRA